MRFFTIRDVFYVVQAPRKALLGLNAIIARLNNLAEIVGTRTLAEDTNDTGCKVTGVSTDIGDATAHKDNTSTGSCTADGVYVGDVDAVFEFEVVKPCDVDGDIDGMKFKWRRIVNSVPENWSNEIVATGSAQNIKDGLTIEFEVSAGENFVEGDIWTVECTTFKVNVATGDYIQDNLIKVLPKIEGVPVGKDHTKVFIDVDGAVKSGVEVPYGAVSLATISCDTGTGSVTVTDARKFAIN